MVIYCFLMLNYLFTFASWNIRGLGQVLKCGDVLSELINIKPNAVFLQETKLETINKFKAKTFLPSSLDALHFKPAIGSSGGLINAFATNQFSLISQSNTNFTLTSVVTCLATTKLLHITNIYLQPITI